VWMSHWGLSRDPFAACDSAYVTLPSHDEAVARLVYAVETSLRRVTFAAAAGMGKTTVLRKALSEVVSPRRRFASVSCPPDATLLLTLLAERLGQRVSREPSRLEAWRALERAVRLASLQGFQIVLAVDDCGGHVSETARDDVDLLVHLGSTAATELTIIQVKRTEPTARSIAVGSWELAIGLQPLTRSQTERYITAKLERAGGVERIFTPRAVTRLHGLSLGVPRRIEQLALLCLMAGAVRGLEVIHPDLVDGVARERWSLSVAASHS
jgi:type II secretory pathway predicted ATPase ExeA